MLLQWYVGYSLPCYPTSVNILPTGIFWTLFYRCNMVLYRRSKARNESLIKPINLTGWALFICIVAVRLILNSQSVILSKLFPASYTGVICRNTCLHYLPRPTVCSKPFHSSRILLPGSSGQCRIFRNLCHNDHHSGFLLGS